MTDQPATPFDGDPLAAIGLYAAAEHELEQSAAHAYIDDRVAQERQGTWTPPVVRRGANKLSAASRCKRPVSASLHPARMPAVVLAKPSLGRPDGDGQAGARLPAGVVAWLGTTDATETGGNRGMRSDERREAE
jgi:hypothetical protein